MHVLRHRCLPRRAFLRGVGACVALPWLEAMVPAGSRRGQEPPLRAVFVSAPNGKHMAEWRPAAAGNGFALPWLLEPLAPVRSSLTVISGLALDPARAHGDGAGDHARAAAAFLTCAHPRKTGGADLSVGVSVDQVLAARVGERTRFPSLELAVERGASAGICDSGYSCAYSNNVSWRSSSSPVARETEPRAVFARLFGDPTQALDAEQRAQARAGQRSVLDAIRADAKSLLASLGPGDRRKLDDYLAAVRELELRLAAEQRAAPPPAVPRGLMDDGMSLPAKLGLFGELIALAFSADLVRVVSLMLGNEGSNRSYGFLGVTDGHHELSHHGRRPEKLAGLRVINRFHVEQLAAFLQRLQREREGEHDLLFQSFVAYGSGISDGDRHNHDDLPILVAGRAGGAIRGDRHLVCPPETPLANLWLAALRQFGGAERAFGDSTGALEL